MQDKRTLGQRSGSKSGSSAPAGESQQASHEPPRPTSLPDFPTDDGATTGAVRVVSESDDPTERDSDRGSHKAR